MQIDTKRVRVGARLMGDKLSRENLHAKTGKFWHETRMRVDDDKASGFTLKPPLYSARG